MIKVIDFFIRKPIWANALIFLTVIFGLISLVAMASSFFPELEPTRITISVFYPGASPEEMEEGVTVKIEESLKGISGIEETESTSSENAATITSRASGARRRTPYATNPEGRHRRRHRSRRIHRRMGRPPPTRAGLPRPRLRP